MERAVLDGVTLAYEVAGRGEPVVFIHGVFVADAFRPVAAEPSLAESYRLIMYHRRGYVGSSPSAGPVSIAQHAADCRALLRHVGVERAHVVGHSLGGAVALQLALEAPDVAHSLAVLEPAIIVGQSGPQYRDALLRSVERYRTAGAAIATDEGLGARWPGYQAPLERMLPGAFDQAVADASATYEQDNVGLVDWQFGEAEARRITQPVLVMLGGESEALWARFGEAHRLLLSWLKRAEECVIPGTTHMMHLERPHAVAEGIAAFFARHPLARLVSS